MSEEVLGQGHLGTKSHPEDSNSWAFRFRIQISLKEFEMGIGDKRMEWSEGRILGAGPGRWCTDRAPVLESGGPEFKYNPGHLLAVPPWARHLIATKIKQEFSRLVGEPSG